MMKKILLLLFCLIFFLISGIGFSEMILSGLLASKLELTSGETYTVEGDMFVRTAGQFSMAANQSGVEFRCLPGVRINVESDFTGNYLFDIKGTNFHIDNCIINFELDNKIAFYYDTSGGGANITHTTISGAYTAVRLHKVGGLSTISYLTLENVNTGISANSRFSDQIRGNITLNELDGSNVAYYISFSGNVVPQPDLFLNISNMSVSDFTKISILSLNTPTYTTNVNLVYSVSQIDFTGSLFKELNITNSSINQLKISNNSTTNTVEINISDTTIDDCGEYCIFIDAKVFPLVLTNAYFDSGNYGIKTGSNTAKEIYFGSINSTYTGIDTALSFLQKTMTFQSTGDDYKSANVILGNISVPENVTINSATALGDLTVINPSGALAVMDSDFVSEAGLLLSNCNTGSLIGLKNVTFSTAGEIKTFVDGFFEDNSCYPYLLSVDDTKINTDKFWAFNKSAGSENPDVTGEITDADASDFSATLAYDYPLSISSVTSGYTRLENSSLSDKQILDKVSFVELYNKNSEISLTSSEIETITLENTKGLIKSNPAIGTLALGGLGNDLEIYDNRIYAIACSSLNATSDTTFNITKNAASTNILGEKGIGGNWWSGFSDSSTKCKNEDDDAYCDAKYSFTCNGKTYEDLYPLTLLGPTEVVVDDEDDDTPTGPGGGGSGDNSCTKNSDCLGTESCVSGKCTSLKCATNQVISNNACVDCVSDGQCPLDSKCSINKCEKIICKTDEKVENHKCVKLSGNAGMDSGIDKDIDVDTGVDKDVDADVNAPDTKTEEPGFFKKLSDWFEKNKLILGIIGGVIVLLIIALVVILLVLKHKKKKELLGEEPKEEPVEAEKEEKDVGEPETKEEQENGNSEDKDLDTSSWER